MQRTTPLPEVARYLGRATADRLLGEPWATQNACLVAVRVFLTQIESAGVTLDPILMEERLHELVMKILDGLNDGRT